MAEARIIFRDKDDGSVEMFFESQKDGSTLNSRATLLAFLLAKRGLTNRDSEKYDFPGSFEFKVVDE